MFGIIACGVWSASKSRSAYFNGGGKATNSATQTPSGINATAIGAFLDTSPDRYHAGMVAEAAIWNVALTDAEVAVLAAAISPLAVRPGSLVAYWPLIGNNSP